MLFRGLLWYQQSKQQVYRLVVVGIEIDTLLQFDKCGKGGIALFQATVRDRYPMAKAGTAEPLTGEQAVKNLVL